MAPRPVKNKRRTAAYYAANPEARKKKAAYDKKYHSTPERRKYRAALSAERRARGIDGKGGGDLSHTTGGGFKRENPSTNRARNGHGGRRRLAKSGRRPRR
jgi:hypothetical protein